METTLVIIRIVIPILLVYLVFCYGKKIIQWCWNIPRIIKESNKKQREKQWEINLQWQKYNADLEAERQLDQRLIAQIIEDCGYQIERIKLMTKVRSSPRAFLHALKFYAEVVEMRGRGVNLYVGPSISEVTKVYFYPLTKISRNFWN